MVRIRLTLTTRWMGERLIMKGVIGQDHPVTIHGRIDPGRRGQPGEMAPILLEENVWFGERVTILSGVPVGREAIVRSGVGVGSAYA
jgi:acetyltransferase-like isoleucine patch superfamily enzyme